MRSPRLWGGVDGTAVAAVRRTSVASASSACWRPGARSDQPVEYDGTGRQTGHGPARSGARGRRSVAVTEPASSSSRRCLLTAGRLIGRPAARSTTRAGPAASSASSERRTGSASAPKTSTSTGNRSVTGRRSTADAREPCAPRGVGLADVTPAPRARRPQAAASRGPQRRDPDRAQAGVDQDPGAGWARSTPQLQSLVKSEGLHTVCQEAGCPNIFECWEDREATFLIGGDQCTRRCDFCQIDTGKPQPLDRDEPRRVAESVQKMGLRYATITGVARDDLPDGGAWLYAETVRVIHELNPGTGVENLIPDFNGKPDLLARGLRVPARGARPQRRDGAADLQADPAGVPLRPLARRAHPGPRLRPGHQVQPDPRHGRDPRGGQPGAARPARGRQRADHDHPVPPPLGAAPPGRALGQARGVRRAGGRGRGDRLLRRAVSGPLVRSSYRAGRLYRQAMDARPASRPPDLSPTVSPTQHGGSTAAWPRTPEPEPEDEAAGSSSSSRPTR